MVSPLPEKSDASCALRRTLRVNVDELLTELECALKAEESDLDRRVDVYNRIVSLAASYLHIPHPVVCPQLVPVDDVRGNDYNPNKVAPPEMRLLKLSIHKDGFTMPVVVARDGKGHVVVDGFHRRQVAKTDVSGSLLHGCAVFAQCVWTEICENFHKRRDPFF